MPTTTGWEVHEIVEPANSTDARFKTIKRHTGFTTEQQARDFVTNNNLKGAVVCEVVDQT